MLTHNERIERLIALVDQALAPPPDTPEVADIKRRFEALPPQSQRRVAMLLRILDFNDTEAEIRARWKPFQDDIESARRWAPQMGKRARRCRP